MPTTIIAGFDDFHTLLTPSSLEVSAAVSHRQSLLDCLQSKFGITGFFRTGSFGNGTSVSRFSDVDYFAVTPVGNLFQDSTTSLQKFRDTLSIRYPNTGVRLSCPAVKVPFNGGTEHTEVLPVYQIAAKDGQNVYGIPDCAGAWMKSSPHIHNAYVSAINTSLKDRVKPLVRFVKAWKFYNKVKVSSFYLEMRVAKWASSKTLINYSLDVRDMLKWLFENEFAKLQDPTGVSGYIVSTYSDNQLKEAVNKAKSDYERAVKAVEYQQAGNMSGAFERWGMIYNNKFPKFG